MNEVNPRNVEEASQILKVMLRNQKLKKNNTNEWNKQIAAQKEIRKDYKYTCSAIETINSELKGNLNPRAIVGHAQSKHCTFRGVKGNRGNTTLDDIVKNIGYRYFYHESQNAINKVGYLVDKLIDEPHIKTPLKVKRPLFGIPLYQNFLTQPFLEGIFYGGLFDNYEDLRVEAEKKYNIKIGGGESWLINKRILKSLGINIKELTSGNYNLDFLNNLNYKERTEVFKKIGLIKEKNEINLNNMNSWNEVLEEVIPYNQHGSYFQEYIRYQKGSGVSDDYACLSSAFLNWKTPSKDTNWGLIFHNKMNGSNASDTVDTLCKGTKYFVSEGFDELIAKYANKRWFDLLKNKNFREQISMSDEEFRKIEENPNYALVSKEQLIDFIALNKNPLLRSIVPKTQGDKIEEVHSSARYFLQKQNDEKYGVKSYTLEQERLMAMRILSEELNKYGIRKIKANEFYSNNKLIGKQLIGFNRSDFNSVFNYYRREIVPRLTANPEQRQDLIYKLYNN